MTRSSATPSGTVRAMRVDVMTIPGPVRDMATVACDITEAGFDGVLFTERGRTAYLSATAVAIAAPSLEICTGSDSGPM